MNAFISIFFKFLYRKLGNIMAANGSMVTQWAAVTQTRQFTVLSLASGVAWSCNGICDWQTAVYK